MKPLSTLTSIPCLETSSASREAWFLFFGIAQHSPIVNAIDQNLLAA